MKEAGEVMSGRAGVGVVWAAGGEGLDDAHPQVEAHELLALLGPRQGDVDALLEPAAQRLVHVPGEVGRGQHHHLPPLAVLLAVDAVHLRRSLPYSSSDIPLALCPLVDVIVVPQSCKLVCKTGRNTLRQPPLPTCQNSFLLIACR